MVLLLSYIIAIIITIVLAITLYPIAFIFWILGIIGRVVGRFADIISSYTTEVIKKLWLDIKKTRVIVDGESSHQKTEHEKSVENETK